MMSMRLNVNTKVALGGIIGGHPFAPYAALGGHVILRVVPIFIPNKPIFQPSRFSDAPNFNSKCFPSSPPITFFRLDANRPSYLTTSVVPLIASSPFPITTSSTITPFLRVWTKFEKKVKLDR